ncbi:unnamed protein product [Effrenium voratum]|nr:unnamed protein product [Effrenium voratum]
MGGECFKRLKEAEGIVAAFLCSLVYTALLASNKQLQSLDWPYFFISGSAALLVSLFNLAHLWWRRLLHVPSDVKWVILRGSLGSTSNCLSVFAVLAGAHVGSIAALRSANSIVASLGTVALGEEFGWMHLVSVTLFVLGAVLTADPEEVLATLGSTLLGNGLALASGICNGCAFLTGRKVKDVHPSFLIISNTLHTWILCWTLHFVLRVPDESFQSMEGVHLQSIMLLLCIPMIMHFLPTFSSIASQKCSAAVATTVITATNMLLGYGLDYLLYQRLVQRLTFVGAILIFLAVLTMLLTQVRRDSVKDKLPVDEDRDIESVAAGY